jgi:hypothetical protein
MLLAEVWVTESTDSAVPAPILAVRHPVDHQIFTAAVAQVM